MGVRRGQRHTSLKFLLYQSVRYWKKQFANRKSLVEFRSHHPGTWEPCSADDRLHIKWRRNHSCILAGESLTVLKVRRLLSKGQRTEQPENVVLRSRSKVRSMWHVLCVLLWRYGFWSDDVSSVHRHDYYLNMSLKRFNSGWQDKKKCIL